LNFLVCKKFSHYHIKGSSSEIYFLDPAGHIQGNLPQCVTYNAFSHKYT